MIQYYKNITSPWIQKIRFTRDLHGPKLVDALEEEGETQEPVNGTDQENLLHDRYASAARSEYQQELHQGPSFRI